MPELFTIGHSNHSWNQFLELLRAHIAKEDNVLFNMADQLVQGEDLSRLSEGYEAAANDTGYRSTFDRCRDIADRLVRDHGGRGA